VREPGQVSAASCATQETDPGQGEAAAETVGVRVQDEDTGRVLPQAGEDCEGYYSQHDNGDDSKYDQIYNI
jgi:hypothetical protein